MLTYILISLTSNHLLPLAGSYFLFYFDSNFANVKIPVHVISNAIVYQADALLKIIDNK